MVTWIPPIYPINMSAYIPTPWIRHGYEYHILYRYTGWGYTYPSEKYEFVSWDDYSPYNMENKKCSKPPTSILNLGI
jgi:hypothetical protein